MRAAVGLSQVAGLPEHARTLLAAKNILTDQDFWEALSGNPSFLSTLALGNDEQPRVVEVMARHALASGVSMTRRPVMEHIPDVVIAAIALTGFIALQAKPWRPPAVGSKPAVRVVSKSGIQAFEKIREEDVAAGSSTRSASPVAVGEVVGQYPTESFATGSDVDPAKLVAVPDGVELTLLQVSLAADASWFSLKPPQRIGLAASAPGSPATGIVVEDVYVLRVQQRGDGISVVIGATAENARALAPFLASGKLFPLVQLHQLTH